MVSPKVDKRITEEWKMLFSISLVLVVLFIIGEVVFIRRKRPDILAEAEPYLTPLPESLNVERLDNVYDASRKMPLTPEEFLQGLDKNKLNILQNEDVETP